MKFAIDAIQIGERKRELGDVTSLAESIKELGLLNPITIKPDGSLIAGYHRIEACKRLGWAEIEVNVADLTALQSEMAEIDENLIRNELHWFDRDKHLARRKEIYEELHPETRQGVAQAQRMNKSLGYNVSDTMSLTFAEDTASKIGVSDRTIERSIQRANTFTEEQGEILKKAEITQTDATLLARLEEPKREAVIEAIASGNVTDVKQAITKSPTLTALQSSDSNEWYTPTQYVEAARELMGGIDLDPASNEAANKVVQATAFYSIEDDGLNKPWSGRVWLNPPYGFTHGSSNQEVWSRRLMEQYHGGGAIKEAVLLVNANTEARWFQSLYNYLICFTNHRIRFYNTTGESSQPTQGNALIHIGGDYHQDERFIRLFSQFGTVVRRVSADEY